MIARASASPTNRIARSDLEQVRQSIESWERQGQEAGRDGDAQLAAGYTEDVADSPFDLTKSTSSLYVTTT